MEIRPCRTALPKCLLSSIVNLSSQNSSSIDKLNLVQAYSAVEKNRIKNKNKEDKYGDFIRDNGK